MMQNHVSNWLGRQSLVDFQIIETRLNSTTIIELGKVTDRKNNGGMINLQKAVLKTAN